MSKTSPANSAAEPAPSNITPLRPTSRRKAKGEPATGSSGDVDAGGDATQAAGVVGGFAGEAGQATALPVLVVFGRDDSGKAHASSFGAADEALAIKAAGMMGFSVLPITTDAHRTAAASVARGRVFASGRAFSPFCSETAYTALAAFPEAYRPAAPMEAEPEPLPPITGTPQTWDAIGIGSLVLASENTEEGWFAAVVSEDRGEGVFVLRWRDWGDHPAFARNRDGLALLPAAAAAA